ncbi:hypothetical protein VTN77DRAFT_7184 [Rasamsonia byssochlamydoides]|uniref:uncharacterized protein n=1 Tax=Rasamsonia byssochlamydoides TaxID=89139 RepID=UPI003744ACC4
MGPTTKWAPLDSSQATWTILDVSGGVEGHISSHSISRWLTGEVGNGRHLRVSLHAGIGRRGLKAKERTPNNAFVDPTITVSQHSAFSDPFRESLKIEAWRSVSRNPFVRRRAIQVFSLIKASYGRDSSNRP